MFSISFKVVKFSELFQSLFKNRNIRLFLFLHEVNSSFDIIIKEILKFRLTLNFNTQEKKFKDGLACSKSSRFPINAQRRRQSMFTYLA
jgi:hypothetical protein